MRRRWNGWQRGCLFLGLSFLLYGLLSPLWQGIHQQLPLTARQLSGREGPAAAVFSPDGPSAEMVDSVGEGVAFVHRLWLFYSIGE